MPEEEIHLDLSTPSGIHPRTGRKRLSDSVLARLKPIWREQWKRYSHLDDAMIKTVVDEYHCGPFTWPGTRIVEGGAYGMRKVMKALQREWKGRSFSASQFYREAKRRLNDEVRKTAKAYDIEDPWGFEYYLLPEERKKKRELTHAI